MRGPTVVSSMVPFSDAVISADGDFGGGDLVGDLDRFREKVPVYLHTNEDHLAVQKLRRNRPLSGTDLAGSEGMLSESGVGDKQDIDQARRAAEGLRLFIRFMVGLDGEAAPEALSEFPTGRALNAAQLNFLNLIINDLTANGDGLGPPLRVSVQLHRGPRARNAVPIGGRGPPLLDPRRL
ncbi:type I restriction-modification enzyme R subunit C-terminal domain-containing protein [Micromonospora zamorensis]|uniref:type I restriction-modification enzyme R subunit C-terminal domain-containing protein n=1 Tax=Micromonospora zamorensis TaxID=709883 RepID=UPI0033E4E73C